MGRVPSMWSGHGQVPVLLEWTQAGVPFIWGWTTGRGLVQLAASKLQ